MPDPAPEPEPKPDDIEVLEHLIESSPDVIVENGHVSVVNADGSMTVGPAGEEKKKERLHKKFADNLAEDLADEFLASIATRLLEGIEQDILSRKDWEETAKKGADLLGVKLEEASGELSPDGMLSRVKHTGLLRACLSMWANSRAELLPVNGPVKVRDDAQSDEFDVESPNQSALQAPKLGHNGGPPLEDGADPPLPEGIPPPTKMEKRNALADAFEKDMNHYLTVVDKEYYPDFSRMLMSRGVVGCQFREVYEDPILRRPVSRWVKGTDLIVSNDAVHMTGATRVTKQSRQRQSVVKRLQVIGHWRKVQLVVPTTQPTPMDRKIAEVEGIKVTNHLPEDQLHTIYECYCEMGQGDLAKDETGREPGYALPYRVTIDKESRVVLEVRRDWKMGDKEYQRRRRFVKYGLVPGLGFYDWGFVHLVGNPVRAASMIQQNLQDTGMLANFPGGIMRKSPGSRQRTTEIRPSVGEFVVMDTGGLPITDFVMPWPYKEPSAALAALGQDIAAQINAIAGVVEIPVGEGMSSTPVGTIMAYLDSVTRVPSAVHKDDHIAQQEEFEMLRDLFAENPSALWKFARTPKRKWEISKEITDQNLVPAADPNVPSQTHRLMQIGVLDEVAGKVQYAGIANQRGVYEAVIRTLGFSNTGEFTLPPQPNNLPPPDPKVVAANVKAESEREKSQARLTEQKMKGDAKENELILQSAENDADRTADLQKKAMDVDSERLQQRTELIKHGADKQHDMAKHGMGILSKHRMHGDQMAHKNAGIGQKHIAHLNELAAARDTAKMEADAGIKAKEATAPTGGAT